MKKIITGSRYDQACLIDEAVEWLEAMRDEKCLHHQMAIILEIIEED